MSITGFLSELRRRHVFRVAASYGSLALALVMLGEKGLALQEAVRALVTMPVSRDALAGAQVLRSAAIVHANAGAEEGAVSELEQLIQLPAGVHVQELKLDPVWDPLRSNPRFQKLLAEHLPKDG